MKNIILGLGFVISFFVKNSYGQEKSLEDFKLINIYTDQVVTLADYQDKQIIVVIFTSTLCPYSNNYDNRIKKLSQAYASRGVQFLLVNAFDIDIKEGEANKMNTTQSGDQSLVYVSDDMLKLTKQLGATKTPEAFVFTKSNHSFVLKYTGAIDDNPQAEFHAQHFFLKEAIEASLNKIDVHFDNNRAMGCMIKARVRQ